jgi:hypothetical protein
MKSKEENYYLRLLELQDVSSESEDLYGNLQENYTKLIITREILHNLIESNLLLPQYRKQYNEHWEIINAEKERQFELIMKYHKDSRK